MQFKFDFLGDGGSFKKPLTQRRTAQIYFGAVCVDVGHTKLAKRSSKII